MHGQDGLADLLSRLETAFDNVILFQMPVAHQYLAYSANERAEFCEQMAAEIVYKSQEQLLKRIDELETENRALMQWLGHAAD